MVELNGLPRAAGRPSGGVIVPKGRREGGAWGLEEILEVEAVSGWPEIADAATSAN